MFDIPLPIIQQGLQMGRLRARLYLADQRLIRLDSTRAAHAEMASRQQAGPTASRTHSHLPHIQFVLYTVCLIYTVRLIYSLSSIYNLSYIQPLYSQPPCLTYTACLIYSSGLMQFVLHTQFVLYTLCLK